MKILALTSNSGHTFNSKASTQTLFNTASNIGLPNFNQFIYPSRLNNSKKNSILNTPQGPSQLQQQHLLEQQNVVLEQILKSQNIQKTEDSGNVNKGRIHFSLFYPNLSH